MRNNAARITTTSRTLRLPPGVARFLLEFDADAERDEERGPPLPGRARRAAQTPRAANSRRRWSRRRAWPSPNGSARCSTRTGLLEQDHGLVSVNGARAGGSDPSSGAGSKDSGRTGLISLTPMSQRGGQERGADRARAADKKAARPSIDGLVVADEARPQRRARGHERENQMGCACAAGTVRAGRTPAAGSRRRPTRGAENTSSRPCAALSDESHATAPSPSGALHEGARRGAASPALARRRRRASARRQIRPEPARRFRERDDASSFRARSA